MHAAPSFEEVIELQNKAIEMQYQHWLHKELGTFQFWLLLLVLVVPWLLWWKYADKKRLVEILLYGFMVLTVATVLDEVGCQLNLWEYYYDIEPYFPRLIPLNYSALPVSFMLIYQAFPTWRKFVIAHTALAAVFAFICEPFLIWLKIYKTFQWEHIYSFPLYIIIPIFLRWLVLFIAGKQQQAKTKNEPSRDGAV
ncbi:MAG TPA: hypothetical protein DCZ10_17560 [Pelotomaculum sp.]|nr:hypothetical protein [Pelotomaculum sp.]